MLSEFSQVKFDFNLRCTNDSIPYFNATIKSRIRYCSSDSVIEILRAYVFSSRALAFCNS